MNSFHLHIITPISDFYSGEIEYLSVNGPDGRFGILHGAMPRVANISAGVIEIKTPVLNMRVISGDGVICIGKNNVTILTDSCKNEGDADNNADGNVTEDYVKSQREYKAARAKIASSIKKHK